MQNTVNDHALQFVFERRSESGRVIAHGTDSDHQVSGDLFLLRIAVIERNNIRKVVVVQVFVIYFQQPFVRTEDDRYGSRVPPLRPGRSPDPCGGFSFAPEYEVARFGAVIYRHCSYRSLIRFRVTVSAIFPDSG